MGVKASLCLTIGGAAEQRLIRNGEGTGCSIPKPTWESKFPAESPTWWPAKESQPLPWHFVLPEPLPSKPGDGKATPGRCRDAGAFAAPSHRAGRPVSPGERRLKAPLCTKATEGVV